MFIGRPGEHSELAPYWQSPGLARLSIGRKQACIAPFERGAVARGSDAQWWSWPSLAMAVEVLAFGVVQGVGCARG